MTSVNEFHDEIGRRQAVPCIIHNTCFPNVQKFIMIISRSRQRY